MSTKADLLAAHKAMAAVLDAKFAKVQEWQAFRTIDKALLNLIQDTPAANQAPVTPRPARQPAPRKAASRTKNRKNTRNGEPTYPDLAILALKDHGRPMTTAEVIAFIGQRRELPQDDPRRVQVNISSALSHDRKRLKNVHWKGVRTWWFAGQELPDESEAPEGFPVNGHGKPSEFVIPPRAA